MRKRLSVHIENWRRSIIRIRIRGISRQSRSLRKSQKLIMFSVMRRRESCMTSMALQPLKKVQQAAHTAVQVQAAALAVSRAVLVAMAVIRSSILRVGRTVIWMISSEIFSGICSMAEVAAVSAARDSSRAMAAVLAAAVSRARGMIFMQRSGSALKMQPLDVRK